MDTNFDTTALNAEAATMDEAGSRSLTEADIMVVQGLEFSSGAIKQRNALQNKQNQQNYQNN